MVFMKKILFSILFLISFVFTVFGQELLTFGGFHTQLYGYTDPRYTGDDKGDYLKTAAWYVGTEYLQRKVPTGVPELEHLVLGAATNILVQNSFTSKDLYAVPSLNIPSQQILSDPVANAGRFQLTLSGFGGLEEEWYGAQVGLSVFLKGYNEVSRQKYAADGSLVNADGRGWVFDSSLILPNFQFRLGPTAIPHFVISLFRGEYDPSYGALVAKVDVPLAGFGSLDVGGSLYQTASIFVEPTVKLGDFTASLRAGTILNYYDSSFTRVGVLEGAFLSGSVGTHW